MSTQICVICLDNAINHMILPCAHVCLCSNCTYNLILCPICRGPVQRIMKVFCAGYEASNETSCEAGYNGTNEDKNSILDANVMNINSLDLSQGWKDARQEYDCHDTDNSSEDSYSYSYESSEDSSKDDLVYKKLQTLIAREWQKREASANQGASSSFLRERRKHQKYYYKPTLQMSRQQRAYIRFKSYRNATTQGAEAEEEMSSPIAKAWKRLRARFI